MKNKASRNCLLASETTRGNFFRSEPTKHLLAIAPPLSVVLALLLCSGAAMAAEAQFSLRLSPRYEHAAGYDKMFELDLPENPVDVFKARLERVTKRQALVDYLTSLPEYHYYHDLFELQSVSAALDGDHWPLYALFEADWEANDYLTFGATLDSGEISEDSNSGQYSRGDVGTWFREVGLNFVRRFELGVQPTADRRLSFKLGRQLFDLGRGHIAYNYYNGVSLFNDFGLWSAEDSPPPLDFTLGGVKLEKEDFITEEFSSYLGLAQLNWYPAVFDKFSLFYCYLNEQDNYFGELLNPLIFPLLVDYTGYLSLRRLGAALAEIMAGGGRDKVTAAQIRLAFVQEYLRSATFLSKIEQGVFTDSTSNLHWLGASWEWQAGPLFLDGVGVYQTGRVELTLDPDLARLAPELPRSGRFTFDAEGASGQAAASYRPLPELTLELAGLFSSGYNGSFNDLLNGKKYTSFLGLSPYLDFTNIFFGGGINHNLATGRFAPSGYNGNGVGAGKLAATLTPREDLQIEVLGAWLSSQKANRNGGGHVYGVETNLLAYYQAYQDILTLALEADYLTPGNFFPDDRQPVWKLAAGFDLQFKM